jgi:CRISPR-associated protein Cas6
VPKVDLAFRITGTGSTIPADHAYLLYSAICEYIPALHPSSGDGPSDDLVTPTPSASSLWQEVGVHPINGRLIGGRQLALIGRSRLTLRLPSDRITTILPLAGKRLKLGLDHLRVGVPEVRALRPAARLQSRLVVIKGFLDPQPFLEAAQRQLRDLGIQASPTLVPRRDIRSVEGRASQKERSVFVRRTLRIRDKEIVGYAVEVSGLTSEESVRLQECGLGGRRRFGCGLFAAAPDGRG